MICLFCQKEYELKKSKSLYCSLTCFNHSKKKEAIIKICERCNKEYEIKYIHRNKKRKYCSNSCSSKQNWDDVGKENFSKKFSDSAKIKFKNGFKHGMSGRSQTEEAKEKIKNKAKARYTNSNKHPRKNKKHSAETRKKISYSRKKSGRSSGINNPMFGKKHSKETREKMSKIISEKITSGNYAGHAKGTYFSAKMNKEMFYRSSWEREVFKYLDENLEVISFDSEPFYLEYFLTHKRHYTPDLFITYKNGIQKLVEIKPEKFINYKINKIKFEAAKNYCKDKEIFFEVWTEKQLRTLKIL